MSSEEVNKRREMDEVTENAPQSARRRKERRNKPKKEVEVVEEAAEEVKLPSINKPKSMPEGRENLNVYGGRDGASDQLRKKVAKLENLLQEERQNRKADVREYVAKIKKLESKVDKVEKGAEELEEVAEKKAKRAAKMKEALTKVQEDQEGEAVQAKKKAVQLAKVLKEKEVESEKAIVKLQEQVETQSKKSKQYKQRLVKICTAIGEPLDLDADDEDLPEAGKKADKRGDGSKEGNTEVNAAGQPAKKLNVADRIVQMKEELEAAQHELRVANAANAQLRERNEQVEQQAEGLTQGQAGLAAEAAAAKEKAQHYLSKVNEVYAALGQTFDDEAPAEEGGEQGGTAAATSAAGKKGAQVTPGKVGKPGQATRVPGKPGAAPGKGGKADSKAAVSAMMDGEGLGPLAKLKSMRDEIIQLTSKLQTSEEAGAKAVEDAAKFKEQAENLWNKLANSNNEVEVLKVERDASIAKYQTLESELNGMAEEDEAGAAEEPSDPTKKTPRGSTVKGGGAMGAIKKLQADKQALVAEKQALVARVAEVQKQVDFHSTTVNEMQELMIQRSETTQALKAQVKEFADALGVEPPPIAGATALEANGSSSGEDTSGASTSSAASRPGTILSNIQAMKCELEQLKKETAEAKKLLGSSTQGGNGMPLVETIHQLAEHLGAGPYRGSDGPALATYAMQMVHDRHKLEALVGGVSPPQTPPELKAAITSGALLSSEMRGGEHTSSGGIAESSGREGSVGAKLLDRILQMQQERDAALKRAEAAEQAEHELDRSLSALLKSHGNDESYSGGGDQDGGNAGEMKKEVLRENMLHKVQRLQQELSMAQDAQQELLMHTKAMVDVLGGDEAEGDAEPENTEGGVGKPWGEIKASSDIAMVRRMAKRAKRVSTMVVNGEIASTGTTNENLQVELQQVKGMKEELEQELQEAKKQIDKAGAKADGMFWENKRLGGAGDDEQAVARVKHAGVRLRDVCEMYKGMSELGKQVNVKVDSKHLISFMPAMPNDRLINPLNFMADYDIEILINNEPIGKFEVENGNTGIFQAAIHYFHIDTEEADVSFDSALPPGSQSSNMIVDLVMRPTEVDRCHYIAQKGDILGLCIRVRSIANHNGEIIQLPARELVYNNNVLRASEVVSAVPEDQKSKMTHISIWPDLTSSWRWQNTPEGWLLARVRWRFLLKKVFPDIADYVQTLATRGQGQ